MSTRCQILVKDADAIVYRHSDGGPDGRHGVLRSLLPLVREFMRIRGHDPAYLTAHIAAHMIGQHKVWCKKKIAEYKKADKPGYVETYTETMYLGFGVEGYNPKAKHSLHGDLAFLYIVHPDHVEVRKPTFHFGSSKRCSVENTELVKRVTFDNKPYGEQ